MSGCKYSVGQKVRIARYEGEGDRREFVVREATVMGIDPSYKGNTSRIRLSVAHPDCFEDMRVPTRILTRLIRAAESQANA